MPRRLLILATLSTLASAEEKVTYDDQAFPIFQQTCLNCHNPDKTKGGLDLSTFAGALKGGSGGKIVEPGDTGSRLIGALMPGAEKPMPPEGEKLTGDKIDVLKHWIEGGLLENKSSSARKPSKPKFETTLRSDPAAKPDGPPPMPIDLLLEPPVVTSRASSIHAIIASPWAPLLAVTGQHQVLLHHTESLELVGILPFPEGDPISLAFTPDARYLIVGGGVQGKSGVTVTFDITTGARLLTVGKEFDSVLAADIRLGFDIVATGGPSRLLKIWNTETGDLVKSIKKHTDWITALDLSGDGVLLASGDRNGGVWVWESETGNEYQTLRGHQAAITATVFRNDSNLLATASEDGTVRFWEMNGGSEVKKIDAHPGGVTAFAFGRDGSFVTAGRDMKAKLWKPDFNPARDLVQNLPALPTAVALDSEGKRAFVADSLGTIRAFQTEDAKLVGEIQSNPPTIQSRLETLVSQISTQQQSIAAAEKQLADKTSARDAARQGLSEVEKSRQQADEIQKAAQAGAEQTKSEGAVKIAADAMARVQAIDQGIPGAKSALEAAEKTVAETAAALATTQAPLVAMNAAVKHWTAAAINSKAIVTRHNATESAVALEDSQLNFTKSAGQISLRADALNSKRAEREQLASRFKQSPPSPEIAAELEATLAAIDISIGRELEALQQSENEVATTRDTIEQSAPLAFAKTAEADSLRAAYRKALE
ncbi:MAG: c-type cytochrome domain-containing protein [Luteolibacter sp.]|uniref:c-type cytochrome domain-containing protein n=1 Tax=Luteolibacter sp. TaxID=1962973 RepID=UPI003266BBBA